MNMRDIQFLPFASGLLFALFDKRGEMRQYYLISPQEKQALEELIAQRVYDLMYPTTSEESKD